MAALAAAVLALCAVASSYGEGGASVGALIGDANAILPLLCFNVHVHLRLAGTPLARTAALACTFGALRASIGCMQRSYSRAVQSHCA